jgi:threonine aldolase
MYISGQLYSKHRYIACQFTTLLKNDLWLKMARHANEKAQYMVKVLIIILFGLFEHI